MSMIKESENTRKLLEAHYRLYPKLNIQDIFKFLYQSAFGCEHLVSSLEKATDFISKEYENISYTDELIIEPLDGNYSRVPLAYIHQGLSATTFGKLFVASAKKEINGLSNLIQKINVAKELVAEGTLPFEAEEFDKAIEKWQAEGYGPVHHSEVFRETYRPSYRVLSNEYIPYLDFFVELDKRLAKGNVVLAIEGGSASGKTTLGDILSELYDCGVFHMDDFFLRPIQRTPERYAEVGGNVDRERFLQEVLQPLSKGETVKYRKFDCGVMHMGEEIHVEPKTLTVIEGAYSMHPELAKYYDFSVFLDISPELQKERIQKRNEPQLAKRFFEEWIPLERQYFCKMKIKEYCDIQIAIDSKCVKIKS